jgi:hypothetical protein
VQRKILTISNWHQQINNYCTIIQIQYQTTYVFKNKMWPTLYTPSILLDKYYALFPVCKNKKRNLFTNDLVPSPYLRFPHMQLTGDTCSYCILYSFLSVLLTKIFFLHKSIQYESIKKQIAKWCKNWQSTYLFTMIHI